MRWVVFLGAAGPGAGGGPALRAPREVRRRCLGAMSAAECSGRRAACLSGALRRAPNGGGRSSPGVPPVLSGALRRAPNGGGRSSPGVPPVLSGALRRAPNGGGRSSPGVPPVLSGALRRAPNGGGRSSPGVPPVLSGALRRAPNGGGRSSPGVPPPRRAEARRSCPRWRAYTRLAHGSSRALQRGQPHRRSALRLHRDHQGRRRRGGRAAPARHSLAAAIAAHPPAAVGVVGLPHGGALALRPPARRDAPRGPVRAADRALAAHR